MAKQYGLYGTVGPAPGFTWDEVRCTDGTLPRGIVFRRRVVKQARCLNTLRYALATRYQIPRGDVSIAVNSWYRSPSYNASIGGATRSQHLLGIATDLRISVRLRTGKRVRLTPAFVGVLAARHVPQYAGGGIGVYDAAHGLFTHLDHRKGRARWFNAG